MSLVGHTKRDVRARIRRAFWSGLYDSILSGRSLSRIIRRRFECESVGYRLWTSDQVNGWTFRANTQSRIQLGKLASRFWLGGLYDESMGCQDGRHFTRKQ